MSLIGNIIWLVFGGFILGLTYMAIGVLYCASIIGIPFGYQLFKIGLLAMLPFGQEPQFPPQSMGCASLFFNIIWIIFGGIELALVHLCLGLLFSITIIGIPFGLQHFKLAKLALIPFSQDVR